MSINIREQFNQYPTDMQQWLIQEEKNKLIRIEKALEKGKRFKINLIEKESGKWLFETTQLLKKYLDILPERNCSLEKVSDEYIFQVWELLNGDSTLNELIAQVETRYEELLKL